MKHFALIALALVLFPFVSAAAYAKDVFVHGYTRRDGTYVQPYVRSAPDSSRANNYGPSHDSSQLMNPRSRDNDNDGIPNYQDQDDDNDGTADNNDSSQYGNQWSR